MTGPEVTSLLASVVSVTLAIVAIVISIFFFFKTSNLNQATDKAANRIEVAVEQSKEIFNNFHTETFSLMRDTFIDFRKHAFSSSDTVSQTREEIEKVAALQIEGLKERVEEQLEEILQRQMMAEDVVGSLRGEVQSLMESAIEQSRRVESSVRETNLKEKILSVSDVPSRMDIRHILIEVRREGYLFLEILDGIWSLATEHRIKLEPPAKEKEDLGPETEIIYVG